MKTTLMILAAMALAVLVGCESPRGGGMSGGEGFKIGIPTFTVQVKQGETQSVPITVNRGEYFKRDVTLAITASKGISVEPTSAEVKASEKPDVHLKITAPADAAIGGYKVYIKATPESGEPTSTDIEVKVVAP